MLKIWNGAFWSGDETKPLHTEDSRWKAMTVVAGGMTVISIGIGFGAEAFFQIAEEAARQLMDRPGYIGHVLGGLQ